MTYITELNPLTGKSEAIPIREDGSGNQIYLTVDGSDVYYSRLKRGKEKRGISGKPYYVLNESLSYSRGGWTAQETRNDDIGLIDSEYGSSYSVQETVVRNTPTQSRINFRMPKMAPTKKFPNPVDLVIYLIMGVEIFIVLNLIIYSMFSGDLSEEYNSLTGNRVSNFDKKLAFVSSLVASTGIADYATSIGFTAEEAEQMMKSNAFSTGYKNPETGNPEAPPGPPQGGGGTPTSFTASTVNTSISTHGSSWGYSGGWRTPLTLGGNVYVAQSQGADMWATVGTNGNSIGGPPNYGCVGCMWFAMSAGISNITSQIYGVEDLLKAVGYTVTYNSGTSRFTTTPVITTVGRNSAVKHPTGLATASIQSTPDSIINAAGAGVTCSVATKSDIKSSAFSNGELFLVHADGDSSGKLSSSGQHWFLIVGIDGDNYYIVNGSGTAKNGTAEIAYTNSKIDGVYRLKGN